MIINSKTHLLHPGDTIIYDKVIHAVFTPFDLTSLDEDNDYVCRYRVRGLIGNDISFCASNNISDIYRHLKDNGYIRHISDTFSLDLNIL